MIVVAVMTTKRDRSAFRFVVWGSRVVGWVLIALAIVSLLQIGAIQPYEGSMRLVSSLILALLGIAWIVGLELFLRFFDKFLSRN